MRKITDVTAALRYLGHDDVAARVEAALAELTAALQEDEGRYPADFNYFTEDLYEPTPRLAAAEAALAAARAEAWALVRGKDLRTELEKALDDARELAAIARDQYDVIYREGVWKVVRSSGAAQVGDWAVRPDGQAWRYCS